MKDRQFYAFFNEKALTDLWEWGMPVWTKYAKQPALFQLDEHVPQSAKLIDEQVLFELQALEDSFHGQKMPDISGMCQFLVYEFLTPVTPIHIIKKRLTGKYV